MSDVGSAASTPKRWTRFGLSVEAIRRSVVTSRKPQSGVYSVEDVLARKHPGIGLCWFVNSRMDALALFHLEAPVEGTDEVGILAEITQAAEAYFRGSWRAGQPTVATIEDAGQSNVWAGYTEIWRFGTLAATLSDDGAVFRRHALLWPAWGRFFDGDTHPWGGSATWNLLARSFASHDWHARSPIELPPVDLRKAGSPHSRNLVRAALAVAALDDGAFCDSIDAYMKHFRERLWRERQTPEFCSVEATVLWHLARRRGMKLPDLSATKYHRPAFKTKRPGVKIPLFETTLLDHIMFPSGLPTGA